MDDDSYTTGSSGSEICKVYDRNDFFTVAVQLLLAGFALLSLWFKRQQEVPRRTLSTWSLDVSKQAAGACYAHVLNMIIAGVISQNIRGESVLEDQCAWYGLSYLIDTTLGLLLAVLGLRWLDKVANERDWVHLKHSGVYEGPQWMWHWLFQCVAWLLILTVTKIIIYVFMWLCSEPLAWVGTLLFAPFEGSKHIELIFVMILFPGVLNVIYFWIADGYLKASSHQTAAHEHTRADDGEPTSGDKKESLMADLADTELHNYQPTPWSLFSTSLGWNSSTNNGCDTSAELTERSKATPALTSADV